MKAKTFASVLSHAPDCHPTINLEIMWRTILQRDLNSCRYIREPALTIGLRFLINRNYSTSSSYNLQECKGWSSPSQYRSISFLSVTSKLIKRKVTDHLNRNNLLSDKQYTFRSSRSSADNLTFITLRNSEALNNKLITKAIAFDIWKAFDTVYRRELLQNSLAMACVW